MFKINSANNDNDDRAFMTMAIRTPWTLRRCAEHLLTAIIVYSMTFIWKLPSLTPFYDETQIISPYSQQSPPTTKPPTFLMGIFSMVHESEHRQMTRSTMLGPDLPEEVRSRICSLEDYLQNRASVNCQIIYTFVVGGNSSAPPNYPNDPKQLLVQQKDLSNEKDLTLLNIQENMNEGKTPSWFHYASTLSGIDYVSKLDLDTLMSMPQLLNFVNNELPPRSLSPPRVFGGLLMDFESCGGKFWASRCDPAKHKPYMSGQFYFCSYDIVQHQSDWRTNLTFKHRKHEDLSFGVRVWAYPHPIKVMALNPSFFWWHGLKNETLWMDGFEEMKKMNWNLNETFFVNGIFKKPPAIPFGP